MKWLLHKVFFIYPVIFSFFYYYRQKEWRKDIEDKAVLFFKQKDPQKIKKIVRGIGELKGARKVQKYLIPQMDKQFIKRFVDVKGIHHLDQAVKAKKGIVLITGHFGNPHLAFCGLRAMGYDVTVIKGGGSPRSSKHSRYKYYDTEDNTIFLHDPSPVKSYKKRILDTLQSGGTIYCATDVAEGKASEEVVFLGKKMSFPSGIIRFAHQTNATIIPFMHFYRRGKLSFIFKEPIENDWNSKNMKYNDIMTKYATILEYYILKYPEQYMGAYGPTVLSHYYNSYHKTQLANKENNSLDQ
ncbi:MAG: lysophospholipid acyltransferase family protein [Desulfobacteraceae bacterium]|nr:lysophospholipid acyltransferase family protein [Desulfobacteraceae bacterium]